MRPTASPIIMAAVSKSCSAVAVSKASTASATEPDSCSSLPCQVSGKELLRALQRHHQPVVLARGCGSGNDRRDNEFRRVDRIRCGRSRLRRDPRRGGQAQHSPRRAAHRAAGSARKPRLTRVSGPRAQRRAAPLRQGRPAERSSDLRGQPRPVAAACRRREGSGCWDRPTWPGSRVSKRPSRLARGLQRKHRPAGLQGQQVQVCRQRMFA